MARPKPEFPKLTQRNGIYQASWYDAARRRTRRVSLGTREAEEAKARFAAFLTGDLPGLSRRPDAGDADEEITIRSVVSIANAYEEEHVKKRIVDPDRQIYALKNIKSYFGDADIATLEEDDFEDYARARAAGEVGGKQLNGKLRPGHAGTVRKEISAFRAAVNHAVKRKRIDSRQTPVWWLPDVPEIRCDKWLTTEEIDKLLGAATSTRVERFIQLAYWTAGRKTPVLHLQANRVDLESGMIDLHPPAWKRTKKRNAIVPIMGDLEPMLSMLMLFKMGDEYLLDVTDDIRKPFEATVKAAGLSERGVTPHWLRHSRATHLLQKGKPIFHVAGLLGDTMATVESVYGHHCPSNLKAALA